jgi:hypothetical protein
VFNCVPCPSNRIGGGEQLCIRNILSSRKILSNHARLPFLTKHVVVCALATCVHTPTRDIINWAVAGIPRELISTLWLHIRGSPKFQQQASVDLF